MNINEICLILGNKNIEIAEVDDYKCGDNDVVLQNICSSICGTDVAVYNHGLGMGHRITIGGEFGHETVCRVHAVGSNVKDFKVGDRVYPYPQLVTGDKSRAGTIGGFSEYIYTCDNLTHCETTPPLPVAMGEY